MSAVKDFVSRLLAHKLPEFTDTEFGERILTNITKKITPSMMEHWERSIRESDPSTDCVVVSRCDHCRICSFFYSLLFEVLNSRCQSQPEISAMKLQKFCLKGFYAWNYKFRIFFMNLLKTNIFWENIFKKSRILCKKIQGIWAGFQRVILPQFDFAKSVKKPCYDMMPWKRLAGRKWTSDYTRLVWQA